MKPKTWTRYISQAARLALLTPNNDIFPHQAGLASCGCRPTVLTDSSGYRIILHNAYDGREFFEFAGYERYDLGPKGFIEH